MEYLFILGRVLFGGYFLLSGINHFKKTSMLTNYAKSKNIPSAKSAVLLSGLMLILGGLGVILGVYYRVALLLIIIFLLVISFSMHNFWKETSPEAKMSEKRDFMKNIALLGGALIILSMASSWVYALI